MSAPDSVKCQCFNCQFVDSIELLMNVLKRQTDLLEAQLPHMDVLNCYVQILQLENANNHVRRLMEDWNMYKKRIDRFEAGPPPYQ